MWDLIVSVPEHCLSFSFTATPWSGRVLNYCAEGRGFDPRPGQDQRYVSSPVTNTLR